MILSILFACASLFSVFFLLIVVFSVLQILSSTRSPAGLHFKSTLFASSQEAVFESVNTASSVNISPLLSQRAYIRCSSSRSIIKNEYTYIGTKNCHILKDMYGSEIACKWGCIGYGDCASVCPQNAIYIENDTACVSNACNGCGLCVASCPNGLISLIPLQADYVIPCAAQEGQPIADICTASCTSCGECVRIGFDNGFSSRGMLIQIDYKRFGGRESIAGCCPQKCIKKYAKKEKRAFTFWYLCATLFLRKEIQNKTKKQDL